MDIGVFPPARRCTDEPGTCHNALLRRYVVTGSYNAFITRPVPGDISGTMHWPAAAEKLRGMTDCFALSAVRSRRPAGYQLGEASNKKQAWVVDRWEVVLCRT